MNENTRAMLVRIRATLNDIEVRGAANLNGLLGCIQALDGLLAGETEAEDGGE